MSKTTKLVTAAELIAVPLPAKTASYTVISHDFIINHAKNELKKAGFEIVSEEYRANNNLEVARGSYIIKRNDDPTFVMSFNWVNSYDKSTKFQCAVGGYSWENNAYIIDKEDNAFIRKHTGDADSLARDIIAEKISGAEKYYKDLLQTKKQMEHLTVNRNQIAAILGDLYFTYDMISIEQLSSIKKEYNKPSYVYSTPSDSLWTVYCHILTVIKSSHPKLWLHQQGFIHNYLKINYLTLSDIMKTAEHLSIEDNVVNTSVLPEDAYQVAVEDIAEVGKNVPQKNFPKFSLLTEEEAEEELLTIEELEDEQHLEKVAYPLTPEDAFMSAKTIVMDLSDPESMPEPLEDYIERTANENNETVHYTDPAGNTFEAPVVSENFMDDFTKEEIAEVEFAKEAYEESIKLSNNDQVTDANIIALLEKEVSNIFGYDMTINVFVNGSEYNIVTNDGQEVTVPISYVNSLIS